MKFRDYINEADDINKTISKTPAKKTAPGKTQYFVSATHMKSGKVVNGYITTNDISNIHGVLAKHGWIITKHYEK